MISIIAAVSDDLGIGKSNELLWHIPEDLKRFRKLTLDKTVIMGRKTWESLPSKPLNGRRNIVITDIPGETFANAEAAFSVEDANNMCEKEEEVFIIGGGSIYRQFMPLADRLYITHVHKTASADTFFPAIDQAIWKMSVREEFGAGNNNSLPYSYIIYERKNPDQK